MSEQLTHREKGEKIIEWAEKVKLPAQIQLSPWQKIVDPKLYISTQVGTMKAYEPGNPIWAQAYMRLYTLKEFLINKKNTAK